MPVQICCPGKHVILALMTQINIENIYKATSDSLCSSCLWAAQRWSLRTQLLTKPCFSTWPFFDWLQSVKGQWRHWYRNLPSCRRCASRALSSSESWSEACSLGERGTLLRWGSLLARHGDGCGNSAWQIVPVHFWQVLQMAFVGGVDDGAKQRKRRKSWRSVD